MERTNTQYLSYKKHFSQLFGVPSKDIVGTPTSDRKICLTFQFGGSQQRTKSLDTYIKQCSIAILSISL